MKRKIAQLSLIKEAVSAGSIFSGLYAFRAMLVGLRPLYCKNVDYLKQCFSTFLVEWNPKDQGCIPVAQGALVPISELGKGKVFPYTFVRRGVPAREDTYPEPSACEVGWPVPFLASFISPVLPPGTHLLLGEQ